MTGIRKKNKILGFIFAVLAVWMVIFQNPSYAAQRGSLNIKTEQAGMTVYLYRVAEKQAGVYVLNEKFQASGADVSGGGSREAAITLTDFVKAQGIQPYRTGTGSGKHVVFRNLPDGEALYLVTGDPMTIGGKTYIPAPVLVEAGGAAAEADITVSYTHLLQPQFFVCPFCRETENLLAVSVGLREYMHRRRFTPEKRTYEELWLQETDPTPGKTP